MSAWRSVDTGASPHDDGRGRPPWRLIGFIAVVAVVGIFIAQNREEMPVDFLFFEIHSRQWVNIALSIVLGVVLDRLYLGWRRWRRANREKD